LIQNADVGEVAAGRNCGRREFQRQPPSPVEHLLRKAAPRTLEAVVAALRDLLDAFTLSECANYFANARYGQA
jgi:hypothetical protein